MASETQTHGLQLTIPEQVFADCPSGFTTVVAFPGGSEFPLWGYALSQLLQDPSWGVLFRPWGVPLPPRLLLPPPLQLQPPLAAQQPAVPQPPAVPKRRPPAGPIVKYAQPRLPPAEVRKDRLHIRIRPLWAVDGRGVGCGGHIGIGGKGK